MAVLRYIAPALAVAGYAAASTCSASTTTVTAASDATALASCRTFTGSIAIATEAVNDIALDGIEVITGSLIVNNVSQLNSLTGDSLMTIGDTFELEDLTILSTLSFPMLASAQTVVWQALSRLSAVTTGLVDVSSLTISDTQLASLDGINLETADMVSINNNQALKTIDMQLNNVTSSLDISFNAEMVQVSFPSLTTAGNMTVRNATSVSIPALATVNGSLGFYSNAFTALAAPNLTMVGGTLAIDTNPDLYNTSFPALTNIGGGLQVQNNTALMNITGYPGLAYVGAVDVYGNFSSASFPALKNVSGDFNLQSYQQLNSTCDYFHGLTEVSSTQKTPPILGTFTCAGGLNNPNTTGTLASGTSNGDDTTPAAAAHTSSSAAHPMLIPGVTGLLGVVAAAFGML